MNKHALGCKVGLFNDLIDTNRTGQEDCVSQYSLGDLPQVCQKSRTGGGDKQVYLTSQLGDLSAHPFNKRGHPCLPQ